MALTFAFGGNTGETPETVKRKRAIAEALMMSRGAPRNIGEGLNALGDGIVAAVMGRRADAAEREGIEGANSAFAPILAALGGGDFPSAPAAPSGGSVASKPDDPRVGSTIDFARGEASGGAGGGDIAELESYIRESATKRGIDPDIAVRVARSEGLAPGVWQSNVVKNGRRETSYGPFQLLVGGGLGDKFQKLYGKSPADPSTVRQQIDFALDEAAAGGWGPWYGAAKVGVGRRTGLENARALGVQGTQVASLDPSIGLPEEETAGISFTPPEQPAPAPAPAQVPAPTPSSMVQPQPRQQVAQALTEERSPMSGRSDLPGLGTLLGAANNQFLSPSQTAIIEALTGQRLKEMDPMTGLERRKMELELRNLENPPVDPADVLAREKFQFEKEQAGKLTPAEEARLKLDREKFEAERKKLMELGAGTTVFDPETRQPVFTTPEKDDRPWWVRDDGTVDPAQIANQQAGRTSVTVNGEPGDGALRKKLDEKTGELWSSYQETGATSAAMAQDMQVLDELIKVAPQGPITGRLAEMFPGISSAGDAFQSIVKRVAPTLRAPGSGATSDIEYDGMLRSLPALRNRPEANAMISQIMKAKAAINIERSSIIDAYGRGDLSAGDARTKIAELDKRSIMTPEMKQAIDGLGGANKPLSEMTDEELEAIINGQ